MSDTHDIAEQASELLRSGNAVRALTEYANQTWRREVLNLYRRAREVYTGKSTA